MIVRLPRLIAIAAALLFQPSIPFAQQTPPRYPAKPVRMVVPFPPGGPIDIQARLVGEKLSATWNQPVLTDNRAGAGGNLGTEFVARSAPDGYTYLFVASSHAIEPALHSKLPFDPVRDFATVSLVASGPYLMMIHPSVPAKSVQELIAYARSQPGKLSYGSAGNGTGNHLGVELFKVMTKTDFLHVPFNGGAPANQALLSGTVSMFFNTLTLGVPYIKTSSVRTLAVTSARRLVALPDIPTIAESGVPGFDLQTWSAVLAPAGTRPEIVQRASQDIAAILRRDDVRPSFSNMGLEVIGSTPEQFDTFLRSEVSKWADVAKASGAKID